VLGTEEGAHGRGLVTASDADGLYDSEDDGEDDRTGDIRGGRLVQADVEVGEIMRLRRQRGTVLKF
jgi:hypothetical protein